MGCRGGHLLPAVSVGEPSEFPPRSGPDGMAGAGQQTGMGCLAYPYCYRSDGQQNPPRAQPPWTADSIPRSRLWRLAPRDNFKRQDSRGPNRYLSPKALSRALGGQAQPTPSELPLPHCCLRSQQPDKSPNSTPALSHLRPSADKTFI